jgi:signal transduction histidine kinase/CheY-like chemotaxis protein
LATQSVGATGAAETRSFARGAAAIFRRMLAPPARFPAEAETAFRVDQVARWTVGRQVAIILLALIWISYFGWDLFHAYRNVQFGEALPVLLMLRGIGALCVASAGLVLVARRRNPEAIAAALSFCLVALYLLSLGMIAATTFPYNYLFYFICLPLILTFMFGLFRLDSRRVYALTGLCLLASFAFLVFAETTDTGAPKNILEFFSKGLSYYNVAALIFLFSFSLIGCVIAVELERSERDAFLRERALSDRNARLESARAETRTKTQALVRAKDELRALAERQNEAKSKFLADAAHDLRQPMQALTNLLGAASHAIGQGDLARAAETLELAQDASRLTRTSFNAVLDISRLESGFVEAELGDVDLVDLVEEVAAPCIVAAAERGVDLRFRWRDARIAVRTDRHLLGRVIANLLSNAIKYCDPARLAPRVLVGIVCLPGRVRLDIVDNGLGIAEADWARVFNPFVQLHNSARDREKGVGLGLSIVNAIVPLLPEHRIDMRSAEGEGTRFSLDLPYGEATAALTKSDPIVPPEGVDLGGLYILYVEDDALVRDSALALFDAFGMRHEAFASCADMEGALPSFERDPDILISDYRLPDGCTAADVVAATSAAFGRALPLIVITGEMLSLDLPDARILRKPVSPEALIAAISASLPPNPS